METNLSQKIPKIPLSFVCDLCDYKCCVRKDFNKHLLTLKHQKMENINHLETFSTGFSTKNPNNSYTCDSCQKIYKERSGLWKHKKKCDFFIKKNIENKELGDAGEELVRDYEIKKLLEKGMVNHANKVKIAEDGEGFDVLSFDENGNEKYIEVKTTEGNEKTPFHISLNEYVFCERNKGKYYIYRLYNYNFETNHADYFIIDNPLSTLLFQPINFKVYLKKIK